MILETVRLIAAALQHATYGVNAQFATLDVEAGETPPEIVAVLDPTQDDAPARGHSGPEWPVLVVTPGGPAEFDGEVSNTVTRYGRVPVDIRYVTRGNDAAKVVREGLYTMRAVARCLRDLVSSETGENSTARNRNNVFLAAIASLRFGEASETTDDGALVPAACVVTFQVEDKKP